MKRSQTMVRSKVAKVTEIRCFDGLFLVSKAVIHRLSVLAPSWNALYRFVFVRDPLKIGSLQVPKAYVKPCLFSLCAVALYVHRLSSAPQRKNTWTETKGFSTLFR